MFARFRAPKVGKLVELDDALRSGTFTPIVGAACSTLDDDDEPRANLYLDIKRKALDLAHYLKERPDDQSTDDILYLREIIDCDGEEPPPASQVTPNELSDLLGALLRIDRLACLIFQRASLTPGLPGRRADRWRRFDGNIHIPRRAEDWEAHLVDSSLVTAFRVGLDNAIRIAGTVGKCASADAWENLGLGADGISSQLEGLRTALFGDSARPALTLPDLLWLSHLLWHVFRFDLKYYPSSAELAFQLALQAPPEMSYERELPTLAQAAQALSSPLTEIRRWFGYYSQHARPSRFYSSLADWLTRVFALQREASLDDDQDLTPPVSPVIITTNYDCEIETALRAKRKTYHVLLPVRHSRWMKSEPESSRRTTYESIWLLKTVRRRNSSPGEEWSVHWKYGGCAGAAYTRSDVDAPDPIETIGKQLEGPLVIKLHGSPLDSLPTPRDEVRQLPEKMRHPDDTWRLEHRIVVSESDYLRALRDDLPDQVKEILSSGNRTLVFLGHSISDWNIRVRLADHIHWSKFRGANNSTTWDDEDDAPAQSRFAVNKRLRRFDTGFMGPLNIDIINFDLNVVRTRIEKHTPSLR